MRWRRKGCEKRQKCCGCLGKGGGAILGCDRKRGWDPWVRDWEQEHLQSLRDWMGCLWFFRSRQRDCLWSPRDQVGVPENLEEDRVRSYSTILSRFGLWFRPGDTIQTPFTVKYTRKTPLPYVYRTFRMQKQITVTIVHKMLDLLKHYGSETDFKRNNLSQALLAQ